MNEVDGRKSLQFSRRGFVELVGKSAMAGAGVVLSEAVNPLAAWASPADNGLSTLTVPYQIKHKAVSPFPRPEIDTGLGIHWSANDFSPTYSLESARKIGPYLNSLGFSWMSFIFSDNHTPSAEFVTGMRESGFELIGRLFKDSPLPATLADKELETYTYLCKHAGLNYIASYLNEPNSAQSWIDANLWKREGSVDSLKAVDLTMNLWSREAMQIQLLGGIPGFPSLAPGGDINDLLFLRLAFDWLRENDCLLPDGKIDKAINLFLAEHTFNKPAVLTIHNYSGTHDNKRDSQGEILFDKGEMSKAPRGFLRFTEYVKMSNYYLGRNVPILSTEGGPDVVSAKDPKIITPSQEDLSWHRDLVLAMARYQRDKKFPSYFNTAFWLALPNEDAKPDGDNWLRNAWFNLKMDPRVPETVDALKLFAASKV